MKVVSLFLHNTEHVIIFHIIVLLLVSGTLAALICSFQLCEAALVDEKALMNPLLKSQMQYLPQELRKE